MDRSEAGEDHHNLRQRWHRILVAAAEHLPHRSVRGVSRDLVRRANAARDAGEFRVAAVLYEEALRVTPERPRLHIQAGHMLKEGGDLAGAEQHYDLARRLIPNDPDLNMQLGHFYKVASRPDEAEAAYRRALQLRPGWVEASKELSRVQGTIDDNGTAEKSATDLSWVVPELLPRQHPPATLIREGIFIRRLAAQRRRTPWGMSKVLQGIEAVRGFAISPIPLSSVQVTLDGVVIASAPLQGTPAGPGSIKQKYVFNLWHDFGQVAPGRYCIEVQMMTVFGKLLSRRDHIVIMPPDDQPHWESDAFVPPATDPQEPLAAYVEALPSIVRPARRSNLPTDVRTILVQRADQLGDLVCSVPAIQRLRALFPAARLIGLLSPANVELARALDLFDEVVVAAFIENEEDGRRTLALEEQRAVREALARHAIDIAIDLSENSDSRPMLLLSGARMLFGFKEREWTWLAAGLELNARDPLNRLETMTPGRKMLALVEMIGLMSGAPAPLSNPPARPQAVLANYGLEPTKPYIVIHTGARLLFSRWPGYVELARRLIESTDHQIILMRDALEDAVLEMSERLLVLTGKLPFQDFDALLSGCAVFVGNDSGVKHLAALRGAPVVSLHMARLNWNEWGQELSGLIVSRRVPCAGCGIHSHPEECGREFSCIRQIKVDEVLEAVLTILGQAQASSPVA